MKKIIYISTIAVMLSSCAVMQEIQQKCNITAGTNIQAGSFNACVTCDSLSIRGERTIKALLNERDK